MRVMRRDGERTGQFPGSERPTGNRTGPNAAHGGGGSSSGTLAREGWGVRSQAPLYGGFLMVQIRGAWLSLGLMALAVSCSSEPTPSSDCVPGRTIACPCGDGTISAQSCRADRTYGVCECPEVEANARLGSLESALALRLDAPSETALRLLSRTLSYNEIHYLDTLDLRQSVAEEYLRDPVARRAVLALVPAWRARQGSASASPAEFLWSLIGGTAWAQPLPTYAPMSMAQAYERARDLVQRVHPNGTTQTPGATTAFANVIAYNVALGGPAPLPAEGPPLGSNFVCYVQCTAQCREPSCGCSDPSCIYTPPCSHAVLEYPQGRWTCLAEIPDAGTERPDSGSPVDSGVSTASTCQAVVGRILGINGNCFFPRFSCPRGGSFYGGGYWTAETSRAIMAQFSGGGPVILGSMSREGMSHEVSIDPSTCTVTWVKTDRNRYPSGYAGDNCTATGRVDLASGRFATCELRCPANNASCGVMNAMGTSSVGGCSFGFETCYW
jgi:hypothetical protein